MIVTKYESDGPKGNRYVGRSALGGYRWCIQHAIKKEFDVAQGTCEAKDLPKDIREKCDAYDGVHYACQWPLSPTPLTSSPLTWALPVPTTGDSPCHS